VESSPISRAAIQNRDLVDVVRLVSDLPGRSRQHPAPRRSGLVTATASVVVQSASSRSCRPAHRHGTKPPKRNHRAHVLNTYPHQPKVEISAGFEYCVFNNLLSRRRLYEYEPRRPRQIKALMRRDFAAFRVFRGRKNIGVHKVRHKVGGFEAANTESNSKTRMFHANALMFTREGTGAPAEVSGTLLARRSRVTRGWAAEVNYSLQRLHSIRHAATSGPSALLRRLLQIRGPRVDRKISK
jgi:hypothetical protein